MARICESFPQTMSNRGDKPVSYLDLPRICFGGTWTGNVATANNQPNLYWKDSHGIVQSKKLFDFANADILPVTIDGKQPTDAELRQMLYDESSTTGNRGAQNWCYWGTNTASFATTITSVSQTSGPQTNDPLVGKAAAFGFGELCDCNPTGSQSTQMFFDGFNLAGVIMDVQRPFSRWVWFSRNSAMGGSAGASGVFETVLTVTDENWTELLALNSSTINALHQAWLAAGDNATGLSIRFGLFATLSQDGGDTTDRVGLVSGAISINTKEEMVSFPTCRTLYMPSTQGPALLRVDQASSLVSIDLFSALSETGKTRDSVTKVNYGPLTLSLVNGSQTVTVGTIPYAQYDMTNVNQQGSIVDLSYAANAAAVNAALNGGASFTLTSSGTNPLSFAEDYWIATDQRDYYLENSQSGSIQITAMNGGKLLTNTTIYLQQFDVTDDDTGDAPDPEKSWLCTMPKTVTTNAKGQASIALTAQKTGNAVIRFTLTDESSDVDPNRDGFANIRILPTDDYSGITDEMLKGEAGFQLLYEKVMRYFYITFPVMQPIVDFSNYQVMTSPRIMQMLETVTDPAKWWTYGYMPRTRDLSSTRHDLLVRWIKVNQA